MDILEQISGGISMEEIQTFSGILNQGYRGNIIYNFHLPAGLKALYVILTHQKEHPCDKKEYYDKRKDELAPLLEQYMEQPVFDGLLHQFTDAIKTEIQLCLMIDGNFVGNVHMPGERKEMFISEAFATRGCVPCKNLSGMAKVIVNVFHVAEDHKPYDLKILGEFQKEETETEEISHVEKN